MEKIQEITECCICRDTLTDPRILTCIHTFCLQCLEQTASKGYLNPGDTMACPLCRKCFVIPNEGMMGLQKNFFMERLIEITKLLQPSSSVISCDVCKTHIPAGMRTNEVPTAIQFCLQCKQNTCDRCCQDHKQFKELQRHELVPIGSPLKDTVMRNISLQFCNQHNKNELDMYCVDCRQIICIKCFSQNHKSHNCSSIDEIAAEFREQIRRDLTKLKDCKAEAVSKVEEIVKLKTDFQKKVEDTERAIIQRGNALKELVDRHIRSLLDELTVTKQRVSKEIAIQQEESETHHMIMNTFDRYCSEVNSKGSNAEICRAANELHLRAEELKNIHENQSQRRKSSNELKFEVSDVEKFLKKDNIVGKIRVPVRSHGKLSLPSVCSVNGVTKLQNKIYAMCFKPNMIRVFDDRTPYEVKKVVEIKEVKSPIDIESCKISNCLYISDSDNRCVWRMNANDHRLTKVLTKPQISDPFTLSITTEGHLSILRTSAQLKQLDIYGSDARLVRRVSLPRGIYWPQHAIQKPNGEFFIIHSLSESVYGPWVISRLTSDGQTVIGRFNPTERTLEMNEPRRLALDLDNNRLFVADLWNDRVIVVDSLSLDLTEVIQTHEENRISQPWRLCYDKAIRQLIVAQSTGNIIIYEDYL